MTKTIKDNRSITLGDIFLDVLEQKSMDEKFKAYVRKVKTLMDVPECAEFLSISLMNAMGHPTPIAAHTIDKAVDCLTHFHEDSIEDNQDLTREQIMTQKCLMNDFLNECRKALKTFIASKELLT